MAGFMSVKNKKMITLAALVLTGISLVMPSAVSFITSINLLGLSMIQIFGALDLLGAYWVWKGEI